MLSAASGPAFSGRPVFGESPLLNRSLRQAARLRILASPAIAPSAAALCAGALVLGQVLLPIGPSFWAIIALLALCAFSLAAAERGRGRQVSLNLFAVAMLLRVLVLIAFTAEAVREGGPFLGPDSTGYLAGAMEVAELRFRLGTIPLLFFGTYDVSHYYLFASAIRFLHADLFGLQMLNAGLTALAAPLAFSIGRTVLPRAARPLGLAIAASPSLVVLSAVDLLKDPSIVCATLVGIWAIVRIGRARGIRPVLVFAGAGLPALLYLRTGRFYAFAYLEAATLVAVAWVVLARRRACFRSGAAGVALLLMFGVAEVLPMPAGWPSTPTLFMAQVRYVRATPTMRMYSAGLLAKMRRSTVTPDAREATIPGHPVLSFVVDLFRRTLGPFPWIAPQRWNLEYLQAGDYLLYPAMLVWYAILPFTLLGLWWVGRDLMRGRSVSFVVPLLWIFTTTYFLQYLAINLSYRQRETMWPVLLLFACFGLLGAWERSGFARWYGAYWAALALMAGGHLALRALLHA